MNNPGVNARVWARVQSQAQAQAIVVPLAITQSLQVAQYFTEDLEDLVRLTHTDLVELLQIPSYYFQQDTQDILTMLYDDISHMIMDRLITGIHLLLCESDPDPNTGFYRLRYHVHYTVSVETSMLRSSTLAPPKREGGGLKPPQELLQNTRLAMLIDWDPSVGEQWRRVRRPDYCLDWVPEIANFDAITLMDYRRGYMFAEGEQVVTRSETIAPV